MYQVGDIVRVKDFDDINMHPGVYYFAMLMTDYCNNEYVIKEKNKLYPEYYFLEGCKHANGSGYWFFHESWLEPTDDIDIESDAVMNLFK